MNHFIIAETYERGVSLSFRTPLVIKGAVNLKPPSARQEISQLSEVDILRYSV